MGTNHDYSKSGIAENAITMGVNICTHHIRVTYENDIPRGEIKITQNLVWLEIRLHWDSIFVPDT